ncbi:hypothetical protein [Mycolicibacterium sp. HS_4_1]
MTNQHNRINRKTSAAALLAKRLAATAGEKTQPIADSLAQAIGQRLEARGITRVPRLPVNEPEQNWYDLAVENHRRQHGLEAQRQDHVAPLPLNGAGVLRAALGGVGNVGTINGGTS